MSSPLRPFTGALIGIAVVGLAAGLSHAQTPKPTANEIAKIRACATKYADNLDDGERQCLFNLFAESCMGKPEEAQKTVVVDCYRIKDSIWDGLLNKN